MITVMQQKSESKACSELNSKAAAFNSSSSWDIHDSLASAQDHIHVQSEINPGPEDVRFEFTEEFVKEIEDDNPSNSNVNARSVPSKA